MPPAGRGAPRRRRPVPGGRRRQGHGDVLATSPTRSPATYGFWLGDAFASGGSIGYDHKAMGITARGAWESVQRHFRELGRDVQERGLHGRRHRRHVAATCSATGCCSRGTSGWSAAFDHRHIFLDPTPDAERSCEERERLFELPRSSWADYDASLISEGGGVFPRTAKSIPLSPQVREALDDRAPSALTPNELIQAILRAPVDLLWNGGIGTYVKATRRDARRRRRQGQRRACA